jgi:hypothetical protein
MSAGKRYFSVLRNVAIGGAVKRPSVCYPLSDDVAAAVAKLAAEGKARVYDEEVRFVSGVAVPVARKPAPAPAEEKPAATPEEAAAVAASRKSRRSAE